MTVVESLAQSGNWLFRRRSTLPLALFIPLLLLVWTEPSAAEHARLPLWSTTCLLVSAVGFVVRALAVGHAPSGTSGRNTRSQVAESLNTTGLYSIVRHPLYVGNTLMWMGVALLPHSWLLAMLILALITLFYERIIAAEELFLRERFGGDFERWVRDTPAIWPWTGRGGFAAIAHRWKPPAIPFSWRATAQREYSGAGALALSFTVVELVASIAATGHARLAPEWQGVFVVGAILVIVLRSLKRGTRLLDVAGR